MRNRPKIVAFFLPQFHAIPENDEWWGSGFTEWTNTRKAKPLFEEHEQPRTPHNERFFDLTDIGELQEQSAQAAQAGLDAFCMYFYWFNGRRLLDRPVELYKNLDSPIPYCLSWANENWTRRWDGRNSDVLMAQDYGPDTPAQIYADLREHFISDNYLKHDGSPVFLVHRSDLLPDPRRYAQEWQQLAMADGFPGVYLIATETTRGLDPRRFGFDALAEFPPVTRSGIRNALLFPPVGLHHRFRGRLMDYRRIAKGSINRRAAPFIRHRGVMPSWDNTARRGLAATVYLGQTPDRYKWWLSSAIQREESERGDSGYVFINAWNEWAEGAYLQADEIHGSDFLKATAQGIRGSRVDGPAASFPVEGTPQTSLYPHLGHIRALCNSLASSSFGLLRRLVSRAISGGA